MRKKEVLNAASSRASEESPFPSEPDINQVKNRLRQNAEYLEQRLKRLEKARGVSQETLRIEVSI